MSFLREGGKELYQKLYFMCAELLFYLFHLCFCNGRGGKVEPVADA